MITMLTNACKRLVSFALVAVTCSLLLLNFASPALAFGGSSSSSEKGTAQMNELQDASEQALKQEPRSGDEVKSKAREGINEVQGKANSEKMASPETSGSRTVRDQAEDALENLVGK